MSFYPGSPDHSGLHILLTSRKEDKAREGCPCGGNQDWQGSCWTLLILHVLQVSGVAKGPCGNQGKIEIWSRQEQKGRARYQEAKNTGLGMMFSINRAKDHESLPDLSVDTNDIITNV